ncbi:MAG: LysM peptidoglycan-binding domain-containing protein [bacterium]
MPKKFISFPGLIFVLLLVLSFIIISGIAIAGELDIVSHPSFELEIANIIDNYPLNEDEIQEHIRKKDFKILAYRNIYTGNWHEESAMNSLNSSMVYIVQPGDNLYLIARRNNSSVVEIKELNNLDSDMILVGQELIIPLSRIDDKGSDDDKKNENLENFQSYTVQAGDNLYLIALKNNTTVAVIKELNKLNSDMIYIGQKLLLPKLEDRDTPGKKDIEKIREEAALVYFVRPGDNLYGIAKRFNISVDNIKKLNALNSNSLYVGQFLYISERSDKNSDYLKYQVSSGDTLSSLADYFNNSAKKIRVLNSLDTDTLNVKQELLFEIPHYSNINYNLVFDYQIEDGENIHTLSNNFDISTWEIRAFNKLDSDIFREGQNIEIPFSVKNKEITNPNFKLISEKEKELLIRAVYSEARGEPFIGQVAVAGVVLNRIESSLFPNTVEGIVFQPGQFEAVDDGQIWLEPNQTSRIAVEAALEGWDPSDGAIYYYNPKTARSKWIFSREVIVEIGDHYFAIAV